MKLARYWSRGDGEATDSYGQRIRATARGWSDESIEAAKARAREVARRVAERLALHPGEKNQYQYGDRPLPEPILEEFRDGAAPPSAVVTRNLYGALVLNTANMMFIDIDREDPRPSSSPSGGSTGSGLEQMIGGLFSSLFGQATAPSAPPPTPKVLPGVVDDVARVAARHNLAVRVYKTAAGYRGLVINRSFGAGTSETEALLKEFGSDRTYIHLCRVQESFRARLTPKPWRCDVRKPPVQYPFETAREENEQRRWESEYNARIARFATCRYVATVGSGAMAAGFERLVDYHDRTTQASSGMPLA